MKNAPNVTYLETVGEIKSYSIIASSRQEALSIMEDYAYDNKIQYRDLTVRPHEDGYNAWLR